MEFKHSDEAIVVNINRVFIAGWTGRDEAAVNHHIQELSELGISPPSTVPLYYRVSRAVLTQAGKIDVLGDATSGEVEPFLVQADGEIWIGLASDHTDRELEAHSIAASKQACLKPITSEVWRYSDIESHLDQLKLQCTIEENGVQTIYQDGSLSAIRPLAELINESGFTDGDALLCGTLSAIGGVRPAQYYTMSLIDPVLNRQMELCYSVEILPIVL
ncbi:DUF2848 domain-containing protein [Oceanospirillaceae bacterium]|jgi:hypothetical protein|nr:DUF2848 domain-containing protein [Oceanospirillaceae bacterium]